MTAQHRLCCPEKGMIGMAAITAKEVVRAVREAVDPEIGVSVVDLGLIYGITIDGKGGVRVEMTMTSRMCPLADAILADVELRLKRIKGIGKVAVDLVWEPAWCPEMMDGEVRANLGV
jgi:metal-sulfur cluster biosynthetic enzyme